MASPSNDRIQAAIISKLKSISAITTELVNDGSTANEIREDNWQGDDFDYPNIRVRMIANSPDGDTAGCKTADISVSIMVFSQGYSSWECDRIAGIIHSSLNGITFVANNIEMFLHTTSLIPAIRDSIRTWRSECLMDGKVSG